MSTGLRSRLWVVGVLIAIVGCGEDKSPTNSVEDYTITVTYGSSPGTVDLGGLPRHIIDGLDAVKLSDIVDTTLVAEPANYAYRIIGQDGFYAHVKGNPDNTWEHLQAGYLVLSAMRVSFDFSLGLPSRYNIKDVAEMKILRKIDFVSPADSLIQYVVEEMSQTAFEDTLSGVSLTGFVPSDVVADPPSYAYTLLAADGFSITITYDQLSTGFFIPELDRVLYTDPDASGKMKVKKLNRITAVLTADQ